MDHHQPRPMDSAITTPTTAAGRPLRLTMRLVFAAGWVVVGLFALAPAPVEGPRLAQAAELRAAPPQPTPGAVAAAQPERDPVDQVAEALTDCPNRLPTGERLRIAETINQQSVEYGYDPLFITALIQIESGCRPAINGRGAIGLTQLLPSTAREVAKRAGVRWNGTSTLRDPHANVRIGVRYLSELEGMLDCPLRALAAYNMGPRPVLRMSTERAGRVGYVRKIMHRYKQLRADHT